MKKALLLFGLLAALTIPSGLWARQAGYLSTTSNNLSTSAAKTTVMVTGTSGSLSQSAAVTVSID